MASYVHNQGGVIPFSADGVSFIVAADTNSTVHANLQGNSEIRVYDAQLRPLQNFGSANYRVDHAEVVGEGSLPVSRYSRVKTKCCNVYRSVKTKAAAGFNVVKNGIQKTTNLIHRAGNFTYTAMEATGTISGKILVRTGQMIGLLALIAQKSGQYLRVPVAPLLHRIGDFAEQQYPGGVGALVTTVGTYALYQVGSYFLSATSPCADLMNCQVTHITPPIYPTCPAICPNSGQFGDRCP